eukprot:TRINITY_DN498_c4_g1_i1.p1 TRINITY_DN498_c4_g1~~TRINITY_DN498_c4_g1_i1.p1  ORF type:complete len:240 (+),score=-11.93 TRINITY_DN498_c4_g1_i1:41-721(+)
MCVQILQHCGVLFRFQRLQLYILIIDAMNLQQVFIYTTYYCRISCMNMMLALIVQLIIKRMIFYLQFFMGQRDFLAQFSFNFWCDVMNFYNYPFFIVFFTTTESCKFLLEFIALLKIQKIRILLNAFYSWYIFMGRSRTQGSGERVEQLIWGRGEPDLRRGKVLRLCVKMMFISFLSASSFCNLFYLLLQTLPRRYMYVYMYKFFGVGGRGGVNFPRSPPWNLPLI